MNGQTARHGQDERPRLEEASMAARLGRFVPLAGVGAAVLTVAGYLLIGPDPDSTASTSTITAYYAAHHAHISTAGGLLAYSTILFAFFGLAVWARIRGTALHPIVAGAALLGTALATASDLANANAWSMLGELGNKHTISAGALQTLHISVSAGSTASTGGLGILLLALASAGILARAFPRWLAWSALVLGILQLTPTPGLIGFFAGLAFLPWMFAASVAMFRHSADTAPATARTGSTAALADPALTSS
jgi:hypothetical protein